MDKVGIGIVGAGRMAARMAETIGKMETVELRAVAARDEGRALEFARKHGAANFYGSYAQLMDDPDVRLVYIATPNTFHHEHCLLCLEHGKHVLCEKPFVMTSAQAREVFELGRKKKLLVAEAMWTRYLPFMKTLRELVDSGAIGKVLLVDANIGHNVAHMERLREPALGGGALLDLGVYALNFAAAFIDGRPAGIVSSRVRHASGVDAQNTAILSYPSGATATLTSSMVVATNRHGAVYGDKGYFVVDNILNPLCAHRYSSDRTFIGTLRAPEQISGLEYEVQAAVDAVQGGFDECPAFTHAMSVGILEQMEAVQAAWR